MKTLTILLLVFCMLLTLTAHAEEAPPSPLALPEDSTVFSAAFASQVIPLCQFDPELLVPLGLKVVHQAYFDKAAEDASHTSAYTVCQGTAEHLGETRPLVMIIIRATEGGEWHSNFDFAPSQDEVTQYAENFYAAAQDIYAGVQPILAGLEEPLVVVTGYSRGAACANLLGMLLNPDLGIENVYVYTAATPNTVRGEAAKTECPNVFNLINPADLITHMPLRRWGYQRLGQDILLPCAEDSLASIETILAQMAVIAPDIHAYYNMRHSLTSAGLSPMGFTSYELMLRISDLMLGRVDLATLLALQLLSPESNLTPIVELFMTAGEPTGFLFQHGPDVYLRLFAEYMAAP